MAKDMEKLANAVTFTVSGQRCPQILCRLLGLFAQQDQLIDHVEAVATARRLRVRITVAGIDDSRAAIIAEKMRQLVSVNTVNWRIAR